MLLTGKPAWSVKMLAVLLVLTLVPSDGLLLKKCDLKSQLEKAFSDLQGKNNEEMIAKLVCTLGHISGFNTSLVTITDQFNNRFFLQGNAEEYSSEMEELPLKLISDRDTALAEDYNGQDKKQSNPSSIDGGDGSGEASIDQSEENKEIDHGPTNLPPDTTVEPQDIHYDTYEMLYGFTNSPLDSSEEYADYYDEQVRKRKDAPSMDGGDGSGEASIDQSEENKGVDHGPTDLPPDTTVEPTDTIYYDTFGMLFGFTNSPEEYADYFDEQVRKRRDAPSMDGGDGSGEASIDQSEENKGVDHGSTDLPPDTTVEPTDTIYYDTFGMLFGSTNSPPDTSEEHADYYDYQDRKWKDAPSMDVGDGSGEAPFNQSEENKGVENALQLDTIEPLESDVKQRSKRNAKAQTTLYGIFQLSDIACESGLSPSQNLCGLSCSALTDDDISDDIACLWDLFNSKVERTFTQECLSVDSSVYFAECG